MISGVLRQILPQNIGNDRLLLRRQFAMLSGLLLQLLVSTSGNAIQKGTEWAIEKGISDGSNPGGTITRQQLAVMMWRYAGEPESNHSIGHHTDAHMVSGYADTAMRWAIEKGIMGGYADGSLKPHTNASRAHVATMMQRFCKHIGG